ncbi:hypothetical protein GPY51_22515 [Photorhabdus laumondii subsp. laumondii]|uniref:Uncharacterized protein n=1 Tax=Photorhabdus laumondii subsp. laumondii TaxID=141679 RepID=A0A6L9JUU7_PHOLM|nr:MULTISPECIES: hypothetical protein [Photorhabdus]MCC8386169.1 hypothetical protein [Photorhabdus laumondii]MCC8388847.1 hypothetical protein [Photorhabdus laumondii]MCC8415316.1 hypothetical protein [Photorhabdus laumondii]MCZ1250602.1 hypothetical protein [Photorhabdus laumondii subsp. laumondii]NDK97131.1 hypothetical protein [Photorhabdus laumondii subsp. laumondii]
MFNTDNTTKTFIFAVKKHAGTEQLIVKVKYVAESYQQAKNALSEMFSGYFIVWMGQINEVCNA